MRILDRYILESILKIFTATIFIFCFLFILIDVASNMDDFIENNVRLQTILAYYANYVPVLLVHALPISSLIAALFCFSNLNHSNEIIALRASGLNFWQIARPAILFSIMIGTLVFFINEKFVPTSSLASQEIKMEKLKQKNKDRKALHNLAFYGFDNRLYYIDLFDPNKNTMEGITIIEQGEDLNIREKITAFKGEWTGIAWKFFNCQINIYSHETPNKTENFKVYPERIMDIKETPDDFYSQRFNVNAMNIVQLNEHIQKLSHNAPKSTLNSRLVDLHQKIAYPFGSIVIILVGLPFALMTGRRKAMTYTSIGIAVVIGFLYYVLNAVGLALGKGGGINPIVAAWIAPAIFLFVGVLIVKYKFN